MKLRLFLAALAAAVSLVVPALAAPSPVQLIVGENIEPTSTFEVRFTDAMIPQDQVGKAAERPPVVFQPALKGSFMWLSQRSGSFKPEEPLLLDTTYTVTLAPGLKRADGHELSGKLRETIKTPPMTLKGWNATNVFDGDDAPTQPRFGMLFNVDVDPAAVTGFIKFVDRSGVSVPSSVSAPNTAGQGEQYISVWRSPDQTKLTWNEHFYVRGVEAKSNESNAPKGGGKNFVWVTPEKPLPPGDWRLVIKRGLPASEKHLRLRDDQEIKVGTVKPFIVTRAEASNLINSGRSIIVRLSKPLAENASEKDAAKWVRLEPALPNLKIEGRGNEITLTGDFELGAEYRVIVNAGLPSTDPFVLAKEFRQGVRFSPVPPRLYLEGFATHQLAMGSRHFHLLAINVPKIRVTARVFGSENAIHALEAYRTYMEAPDSDQHPREETEPYVKMPLAQFPASTWQRDLDGTAKVDVKREIALNWNEIIGANKSGIVLLTAEETGLPPGQKARPGVQAIVQVTDLGTVWKNSKEETFVHVFSLNNGQAAANAKVQALDDKGHVIAEAHADAQGSARLKTPEKAQWLLAASEGDTHLIDFRRESENLSLWELGIRGGNYRASESENGRQMMLFTERSVYKPGETVHLKGIVRDPGNVSTPIPAGLKATLRFMDPQNRRLAERVITLSDVGSFAEDFKLPASGLGGYHVEVVMADDKRDADAHPTQYFEVQEYTPNAFDITIPKPPVTVGDAKIDLPVTAQYYMGKTLSQAHLTWSIDASDETFVPAGFDTFAFGQEIENYELMQRLDRASHFSAQGKADLDAHGATDVASTIPINPKAPQPRSVHLLCEITDLDQQTVSRSSDFLLQSSDYYLGIRRQHDVVHEGETLPVDVVAVRSDGTPTPKPVDASVRLTRVDWQTNHVEAAGGATEYRNQPRFEIVAEKEIKTRTVTGSEGKWVLASDEPGASITVGKPGQYLLEVLGKDAASHPILTATSFNVIGAGETGWNYRNPFQIELAADKAEYLPGQTAHVLVKAPIAGEALVTVEREHVLRSFVTRLTGNAPEVEIPLLERDTPNVFVSVMMLRGAAESPKKYKAPEYRVGYCKLKVAHPESKLTVYVKPESSSYRPGDQVGANVEVLDFNGHPVVNAEVTLYAVDEGVLSLAGDKTPNPYDFFNSERGLGVETGLSLPTLLPEDPEQRNFGNKGYLVGGGSETMEVAEALRKNFETCAFWNAGLRTNVDGRLAAKFTAPDSLTRYRLMAVVQTARDQFGSAESSFEVNKPVMIEPALPRFANVGDHISLRGVVHSLTDTDGEVDVSVQFDGTVDNASEHRHLKLPARGSVAVDIPVTFVQTGQATWRWIAKFSGGGVAYQDATQSTLRVGYPVPLKREMRFTELHGNAPDLLAGLNPELFEGTGVMRVSLTNSRALELREPLDDLLQYPYGCVEQTTSTMIPWITLRDFQKVLPSIKRSDQEVADAVNHGIDHLLTMQTGSGGLSYWPEGEVPNFWGSAYGGLGMALARRAGFQVPDEAINRLCSYLSQQLRGSGADDQDMYHGRNSLSARCLSLYALAVAGRAEPAYHELFFKQRNTLKAEDRALLAMAIGESHGPSGMIAELLRPVKEPPALEGDDFSSPTRAIAIQLMAWRQFKPGAPQVEKLVTELEANRLEGNWRTTQGNCWSLLALSDYFRHAEKRDAEIRGTLTWDGRAKPVALTNQSPLKVVEIPFAKDAAGKAVPFANPEGKKVYAEVLVESRPRIAAQPHQDQGYTIRRRYAKVEDDGTLHELKEPRVGDRVLVTLDILASRAGHYVAVDDPLPATFEAINPAFKSQETLAGQRVGEEWNGTHEELRDDRALFFADDLPAGEYTIRYLARVRAAGTATAPSAKVEEMYHPERFGLTETMQLTSLPLK